MFRFRVVILTLKYDTNKSHSKSKIVIEDSKGTPTSKVNISFIGAGSYAQGNLLPNIPETKDVSVYFVKKRKIYFLDR